MQGHSGEAPLDLPSPAPLLTVCVFSFCGVTLWVGGSKGLGPLVLLTPPQDLCYAGVQVPDCYELGGPGHWVCPPVVGEACSPGDLRKGLLHLADVCLPLGWA